MTALGTALFAKQVAQQTSEQWTVDRGKWELCQGIQYIAWFLYLPKRIKWKLQFASSCRAELGGLREWILKSTSLRNKQTKKRKNEQTNEQRKGREGEQVND